MHLKKNSDETVPVELIFQSILGTDIQCQKANMRLSRQGVPRALRQRCRHRGVELRSKLGSAVARRQRRQEHKRFIYPTTQKNRADTTTYPNQTSFTSSPLRWDILYNVNDLLKGANYASGVVGSAQVGMLRYRQSLPVSSRVLSFPKFARYYRGLGTLSRGLGTIGTAGTIIGTSADYNAMQKGDMSEERFAFRTTGTGSSIVASIYVGTQFGGPYGAGAGAFVGFVFWGAELGYEVVNKILDEFTKGTADMVDAVKKGTWKPHY